MCLFDSIDLEKGAKCKSAARGQDNTECTQKPSTGDGIDSSQFQQEVTCKF